MRVELPVCPSWDMPSNGAAAGWDALCHALSLAHLHYRDYYGTGSRN